MCVGGDGLRMGTLGSLLRTCGAVMTPLRRLRPSIEHAIDWTCDRLDAKSVFVLCAGRNSEEDGKFMLARSAKEKTCTFSWTCPPRPGKNYFCPLYLPLAPLEPMELLFERAYLQLAPPKITL